MFNNSFYPTPKKVIKKMLEPYEIERSVDYQSNYSLQDRIILEPNCGSGNILDHISNHCDNGVRRNMYAIEINEELQMILQGKRYKVIDNDFLKHNPDFNYDFIIMNPPFDSGVDHLLHAFNIQEWGDIICLLNAETIKNPYTEKRKLLKNIIEESGSVEFIGDCFSTAEHKTGVEVALVRISRDRKSNRFDYGFGDKENINFDGDYSENSIALRDTIENICIQYEEIKNEFEKMLKIQSKIASKTKAITSDYCGILRDFSLETYGGYEEKYIEFLAKLKLEIWEYIAKKMSIEKYMSTRVKSDFNTFLAQQGNIAITKENIYKFINIIFQTRVQTMEKAVVEVFDIFTQYYKDNRCYVEGWKTNDRWKVNKKIILPYWVKWGEYSKPDKFNLDFGRSEYEDIDKVMCFLTGKNIESITTIRDGLNRQFDILGQVDKGQFDNSAKSEFFNLKFYKKGTLHLEFKDKWLWEEFSKQGVKGKWNWLPDGK
jgi:hypothetical protein